MVQYQVWIEDEAYAKRAILLDYLRLTYKIVINGMGYATIEMDPADPKIAELVMGRRLKVIRDGKIVFGGRLLREGWSESDDSPAGFSWSVHAVDYAHYAKRRIVVPEAGQTHQTYTDHADDVAKDFVRNNLGSGAVEARRFPDLTVEADEHAAASIMHSGRYQKVFDILLKLQLIGEFDWQFTPTETGVTFATAYPRWGVDRTAGNGVNEECVIALDRNTYRRASYDWDGIDLVNDIYVGGQGEGADRNIQQRTNADSISAYGRCEGFADARHLSLTESLQNYGDAKLKELAPIRSLVAEPEYGTWRAASGTTWDIGDLITIRRTHWGRTYTLNAKVIGITVTLSAENVETAIPELVEV